MGLVKVKPEFYSKCTENGTDSELLFNEAGRPGVLLVHLKYKDKLHKFIMLTRSNISGTTPKDQYLSLPPNPNTRPGCAHGIHYIKIFPIKDDHIDKYNIDKNSYLVGVKNTVYKHKIIEYE